MSFTQYTHTTPTTRIHIYIIRNNQPHELATCNDDSLTYTLRTLTDENQIRTTDNIGVLDKPDPHQPGRWLINPYTKPSDTPCI